MVKLQGGAVGVVIYYIQYIRLIVIITLLRDYTHGISFSLITIKPVYVLGLYDLYHVLQ